MFSIKLIKHVLCLVYFLKKSYFSFLKIKKTSDLAIPTESITSLILKNIVNYFNTELDFIHLLDIGLLMTKKRHKSHVIS